MPIIIIIRRVKGIVLGAYYGIYVTIINSMTYIKYLIKLGVAQLCSWAGLLQLVNKGYK